MPEHVKEKQFESDIVGWLCAHGGYSEGAESHYDRMLCIDTAELFAFIGATQAKTWDQLVLRHGGDPEKAQQKFLSRVSQALDKDGTVRVLRRGVEDQGLTIRLMYSRPASGMNASLAELYGKNRLTVTRQLHYSLTNNNSLDLCLFVNGIPVATAELKNPLNGQTVTDAINQYKSAQRDPKELLLGRRALVHFAVDPHLAYMTTRLAGNGTQFLPFNQGSNPGKLSCGQGNPPNPAGYQTSYLWERVWQYDAWIDILDRFVESFDGGKGKPRRVVFPRFHQWDAVTKLAADALAGAVVSDPALGRVGEVELDRLAVAPPVAAARRSGQEDLRQGDRRDGPACSR
jgi:type I restriction enzyme R subunit